MAFGFVKSTSAAGTTVSTLAITVPAVPVGTLVIVNVKFLSIPVAPTVTDNASVPNTYAIAAGPITVSGTIRQYQFYGVAVTGGATTITLNWTGLSSLRATVDEFSGGQLTNAAVFDNAVSATGNSTAALVALTPGAAGRLISAGIGFNATVSAVTVGTDYRFGTSNTSIATEYRQLGTTSETAPLSWTTSTNWAEIAAVYIPADVPGNFMEFM